MEIIFNVNDLNILCASRSNIVGGSNNLITAKFNFTGSIWNENIIKTAMFKCNDQLYTVILNNDSCLIPTEALQGMILKVGVSASFTENRCPKDVYTDYATVITDPSCNDYRCENGLSLREYQQIIELINSLHNLSGDPESGGYDISEIVEAVEKRLNDSGYIKANRYTNVLVPASSFVEDNTLEDYLYKADINLDGVTENDYPRVIFSLSDVQAMIYAPICTTDEGIVSIYATKIPPSDITIPLIEVIKV